MSSLWWSYRGREATAFASPPLSPVPPLASLSLVFLRGHSAAAAAAAAPGKRENVAALVRGGGGPPLSAAAAAAGRGGGRGEGDEFIDCVASEGSGEGREGGIEARWLEGKRGP